MTEFSFKISLLGDAMVGKTAVKVRFVEGYFRRNLTATLGVDFGRKEIIVDENSVSLNIWDSAGQSVFDKLRKMYVSESKGLIVLFDLNNYHSFENVGKWLSQGWEFSDSGPIPTVIGGNKNDLEPVISKEEILRRVAEASYETGFAYGFEIPYFEISAKTGEGVYDMFLCLAKNCQKFWEYKS